MTGRKFEIRKDKYECDIKFGQSNTTLSRLHLDGGIKIVFNFGKIKEAV